MASIVRNVKIWGILLLGISVFSCSDVDNGLSTVDRNGNPTLSLDMTRSPQSIVDNTQIYVFENPGWEFYKQMLGVTSNNNILSMQAEAGTWNMALVTAETSIASRIKEPVHGEIRTGKLWETQSVGGELPSIPELRTGYLTGQQVIANQQNYGNETVMLYRNVALVKVVIEKTRGLDVNGTHKFELKNVPTTINWAGGLYPDKDHPNTSADPMKGTFTIKDKLGEPGVQDSDTLEFIIPAHKGTDFLGAHNDTTTNKLTVSIDLACLGSVRYEKANVEVPRVPRVNGVLIIRLSMVGQLEINAEVLDWEDVALNADLMQTQLFVDKANVGLAYKDTVYVNTNASTFTVAKDPSATWITAVNKIGNNGVEIIANVDTYVDNSPRSSYITITANNVTKKIPVTQRPDRGTISVDNKRLVFCPVNHVSRAVQVNSTGGNWALLAQSQKASANSTSGNAGNSPVTFTRAATTNFNDFDTYYGDDFVVVKNLMTLDTDTIQLVNCYIDIPDNTISAAAPTGTDQTAVTTSSDITVYGGNKGLFFDGWSTWIHSNIAWDSSTQQLIFTTDREPDDEERFGFMTFHHAECSDYLITAIVHQDILVTIPEFDYFVLKYDWENVSGYDVDIATEFAGNGTVFDGNAVGWNLNTTVTYNSNLLLQWGGDAQNGEGETAFFNAPVIDADSSLPRKITLKTYSTWYKPDTNQGKPMDFLLTAYKGGTMVKGTNSTGSFNNKNYYNQGGVMLYQQTFRVAVNTYRGVGTFRTGGYEHIATIVYDRIKHSATITIHAQQVTRSLSGGVLSSPVIENEEVKPQTQSIVNTYSK